VSIRPFTMSDKKDGPGNDSGLLTKTKTETKRPPMYKVMLLNDDYTPMEFVVHILERFFGLNHAQAFEIMLTVHKKGLAVVGGVQFEVAETKVAQVMDLPAATSTRCNARWKRNDPPSLPGKGLRGIAPAYA
jgi:ATP-dependent Clp protease adaptor protein ClpS